MRAITLSNALAAFMSVTAVAAWRMPDLAPRTGLPAAIETEPPAHVTVLPQGIVKPRALAQSTPYVPDPWQCITENLTQYLIPPKPTGSLFEALQSYAYELYEPCLARLTVNVCPFPAQSKWCAFTSVAPAAVLPAYSTYASQAYSWWEARSSTLSFLIEDCPKVWGKAIFDVPGGEEWLNDTIAFAGCYSEAYITAEPSMSVTLTTTTSSSTASATPSCTVVSGLAVPQPPGTACGLKGTSHALAGSGAIVGYGAGSAETVALALPLRLQPTVLPEHSAYASQAHSWRVVRSSTVSFLIEDCPNVWQPNHLLTHAGFEEWPHDTIAFAGCYADALTTAGSSPMWPALGGSEPTETTAASRSALGSPTPISTDVPNGGLGWVGAEMSMLAIAGLGAVVVSSEW
ncbi:hypothetical protein VE03_06562 [Pseudogymnoascus sp. 23342-1-I1]|nr:hypothetical protein VE03_06562 [Pseudogymnoascus sp. 23342-1-I1]